MTKDHTRLVGLAKAAVVAALYAALTTLIAPLSYGSIQLRISEGLNHLVVFNKRYIWALVVGCFIANLWSPMGIIDIIFGTLETFLATGLTYLVAKHVKPVWLKLVISTVIDTAMMWVIALELHLYNHLPFWPTYATTALGEFISLAIGAVIIYIISRYIDLRK